MLDYFQTFHEIFFLLAKKSWWQVGADTDTYLDLSAWLIFFKAQQIKALGSFGVRFLPFSVQMSTSTLPVHLWKSSRISSRQALTTHGEKLPLGINDIWHYYCNVIQELWLIVEHSGWFTVSVILGWGPVDYNPPLKGQTFSESLFSRLRMDLRDVCWSKCNCVGCGNGLSVLQEANKEKEKPFKQKEHFIFKVAVTKIKKHSTAGSANMITQHRTPTIIAKCIYPIVTWCRVYRLRTGTRQSDFNIPI